MKSAHAIVVGGIVTGVLAGVALTLLMVSARVVRGEDLWLALKGAGVPILGERAHQPGFDAVAVVVGLVCHLAVSIAWGVMFGAFAIGLSKTATVLVGPLFGFVTWIGMFYVVLPTIGEAALVRTPRGLAIAEHLFYGLVLGLAFLLFQRPAPRATTAA